MTKKEYCENCDNLIGVISAFSRSNVPELEKEAEKLQKVLEKISGLYYKLPNKERGQK